MHLHKIEKRKSHRHHKDFVSLEERDAFISKSFTRLLPTQKQGYFVTPTGTKVSVWNTRVIWNEPIADN